MRIKLTRFLPFFVAATLIFAGYQARQTLSSRIAPSSDIPIDFTFVDQTEKLGIHFRHEDPKLDLNGNTRLFYFDVGAAVADFNGDGWMDVLLPTGKEGGKSHFYLNEQGQKFREAADAWGVANLGEKGAPNSPVVFDYDNDGRPDLYVSRLGCAMLFHNTGTRFEQVPLDDCANSSGALPVDTDGDGLLDLYVLRYWPPFNYFSLGDKYPYPDSIDDSMNGGSNKLYRNTGRGFEAVSAGKDGADPHWSIDASVGRFSPKDSRLRIYTANDYGRDALHVVEEGGLIPDNRASMPYERRSGMSVSLGDLDGSGYPHIYVSNIYIPEYMIQENFLWKYTNRKVVDESHVYGVHSCGWAWGSLFADFNLDGRQDLYVANGMITGESKQEYSFLAAVNLAVPDVARQTVARWPSIGKRSLAGRQVDCVFVNTEKGMVNVARQAGVRDHWDGRGVALMDFDNNGAPDLLVTTQDGPPHLLYNTTNPGRHWVGFQLVGRKNNRDGVGARIEVRQKDKSYYRWATGGRTGAMVSSDPRLHFGLPNTEKLSVEVQWPNGMTQNFSDVEPGRYYTLDEASKVLQSGS